MAEVKTDSYDNPADQSSFQGTYSGGPSYISQSFTPAVGGPLVRAEMYLSKSGTPVGDYKAYLYSHTGTYGTSSNRSALLATSTTTHATASLTTSQALISFDFDGSYTLVAGTYYCLVLEQVSPHGSLGNQLRWSVDTSSPTHSGNMGRPGFTSATTDCLFAVYVETPDYKPAIMHHMQIAGGLV